MRPLHYCCVLKNIAKLSHDKENILTGSNATPNMRKSRAVLIVNPSKKGLESSSTKKKKTMSSQKRGQQTLLSFVPIGK